MQAGGAAAAQANHHHRRRQFALEYFRVTGQQVLGQQAITQQPHIGLAREHAPDRVESRLGLQGLQHQLQGFAKAFIAEVLQAALFAGRANQTPFIQRGAGDTHGIQATQQAVE